MEDLALDTVAFEWREALDAAEDALADVAHSRRALQFPAAELRERAKGLRLERDATELELEKLARATHTHLYRHLVGPRASSQI